ncbi:MAG: glutathione S-transferase [Rhodocyclaceae bacterium]
MKLIGMLDSPYVRRVAVSLRWLGMPYEHLPLSVFRNYDAFAEINPVVKAPTLVCDDGTVLMDSTLILEHVETVAPAGRTLMPSAPPARSRTLRQTGLALAACEKSVQLVYERQLRPREKQHLPWVERVSGQLHAALGQLETELDGQTEAVESGTLDQGLLTTAVTWYFARALLPDVVAPAQYPSLARLSRVAETLPAFRAAPHEG